MANFGSADDTYWETAHTAAATTVNEFKSKADTFSDLTVTALASLEASAQDFAGITYSFSNTLGGYTAPTDPTEPDYSALGPSSPTLGAISAITGITPGSDPAEPTDPSGPSEPTVPTADTVSPIVPGATPDPSAPAVVTAIDPGTAPDTDVDLTGAPGDLNQTFTLPPAFAGLSLPTFSLEITESVEELVATYAYTEPTYDEQLKAETKSLLASVLGGNLIVSTAVWDAIWDRARADTALVQVAEEWSASNFAASTGMTGMVNETLLARLDIAEQRASQRNSATRITQAIEEAQQRREDLWNGVGQAIAFETMWIQQAEGIAGRALASAAESVRAAVAVHNSNVTRFNAYVSLSGQYVALGRLELDAALASLDEYRLTLQRSELDLQGINYKLQEYLGGWDGWNKEKTISLGVVGERIRAYIGEWQADQARHAGDVAYNQLGLRKDELDISAFNADTGAQQARHSADIAYEQLKFQQTAQELQKFATQWQGISTQAQYISSILNARVNASNFGLQQKVAVANVEEQTAKIELQENQQDLEEYRIGWQGVQIQKSAEANILNARTQLYGAQVQGEGTKFNYENLQFQQVAKEADQDLAAAVSQSTLGVQQGLGNLQYLSNIALGVTQAYCTAADVAINSSASAGYNYGQSSSESFSNSKNINIDWAGDCSGTSSCSDTPI